MTAMETGARSPSAGQVRRAEKRPHGGASVELANHIAVAGTQMQGKGNGAGSAPMVHREYSTSLDRTLTRSTSINLKRETSWGPLPHVDSPVGAPANGGFAAALNLGRSDTRDPAIDAAMTLTDCFLRRESSLEKLGLLKRETSLGGGGKRGTSMEFKGPTLSTMPPPDPHAAHNDLPPPPSTQRQSSLHSLASIAELTSSEKGCLLYTSPSPRDRTRSRMPSSA
eukprot:TRINITY_DN7533_c0_g1_i1.p1 TRINITY_DN7533_c0_g1~~TRINITY_DN7533_c0_g1_i1.p1  ORF type:complete len:225 (-),score=20.14 TRINITY_DN7533_c0_g1_i1:34-708(-)